MPASVAIFSEATIVRRVQPPSQPPPAGGRSRVPHRRELNRRGLREAAKWEGTLTESSQKAHRKLCPPGCITLWQAVCGFTEPHAYVRAYSRVPAPSGGGSGQGRSSCSRRRGAGGTPALPGHVDWALCAMRMTVSREHRLLEQGCGETRFPRAPAPQGHGETGFPHPSARGRVWEGCALTQEYGETRFPHVPARGRTWPSRRGTGEPGSPIPPPPGGFGRAMPSSRGMGKPGFPTPSPAGWWPHLLAMGAQPSGLWQGNNSTI